MHDPNEEMARLVEWRRKEEARWRAALEKREEERFELLTREWQMAEKRRAADAKARLRTVSEVTRTLKQKLNQLIEKEERNRAYEDHKDDMAAQEQEGQEINNDDAMQAQLTLLKDAKIEITNDLVKNATATLEKEVS